MTDWKGIERNQGKETEQWEKIEDSFKVWTEMNRRHTGRSSLLLCLWAVCCDVPQDMAGPDLGDPALPSGPSGLADPVLLCHPGENMWEQRQCWHAGGCTSVNNSWMSFFPQCVLTFSPLSPRSPLSPFTPGKPWTQIQIMDLFSSSPLQLLSHLNRCDVNKFKAYI